MTTREVAKEALNAIADCAKWMSAVQTTTLRGVLWILSELKLLQPGPSELSNTLILAGAGLAGAALLLRLDSDRSTVGDDPGARHGQRCIRQNV